jgi:hypothetical protein
MSNSFSVLGIFMDYKARFKALKILDPTYEDKEAVCALLREAEARMLDKSDVYTKIEIRPITERAVWQWLLEYPEDQKWKEGKDLEWQAAYNFNSFINMASLKGKGTLFDIGKAQGDILFQALKRHREIPLTVSQAVIATVMWVLSGLAAYDTWPLGNNPYEPLLTLYEMGYIVRRVRDGDLNEWRVGYIPLKEVVE